MVTLLPPHVNTTPERSSTVQTARTSPAAHVGRAATATGPGDGLPAAALGSSPRPQRLAVPTVRARFTGHGTSDVGSLTHVLIGAHVEYVHSTQHTVPATVMAANLLNQMFAAACDLITANPNATRVLATQAASLASRYLTDFVPDLTWRLLGVEHATSRGRVDLAWVHDQTDIVFFDEVKTSRVTNANTLPASWVTQARRYSAAGAEQHEDRFLGTRLIPLMALDSARLVPAQGTLMLLASTAPRPTALAGPSTGGASDQTTPGADGQARYGLDAIRGVR
jgi:hypothetical protein